MSLWDPYLRVFKGLEILARNLSVWGLHEGSVEGQKVSGGLGLGREGLGT